MVEKSELIDQLRIERDGSETMQSRRWPWLVAAMLLLGGAAFGAWFAFTVPEAVPVRAVAAAPAAEPATVQRGSILDASGYVVARRQATVSSKITARVVEVLIEEGQSVNAGEVIARLDDTNAAAAEAQAAAQLAQARVNFEAARIAFDNEQALFRRHEAQYERGADISAQAFDVARASFDAARNALALATVGIDVAEANLDLARRNLDDTIVRAPFAGVVTVKAAQQGEMVSPVSAGGGFTRTGIGTIVDMESLEVEVDVSENFIQRVRPEQPVTVRLNAYPDWSIPASVIAIIPTADRARASVRVRIRLHERDQRVLPEMGVRVAFLGEDDAWGDSAVRAPDVAVPPEAVQGSGATGVVYLIRGDTVERRAVRVGGRTDEGLVLVSGLSADAALAVGDFSRLADGARIRIEP